jgi:hypothetical protein
MFQMQTYIIVVLILSSVTVSAGLEKVLKQAEFIADIYQQLPRSCILIIHPEAQEQGENEFCCYFRKSYGISEQKFTYKIMENSV